MPTVAVITRLLMIIITITIYLFSVFQALTKAYFETWNFTYNFIFCFALLETFTQNMLKNHIYYNITVIYYTSLLFLNVLQHLSCFVKTLYAAFCISEYHINKVYHYY